MPVPEITPAIMRAGLREQFLFMFDLAPAEADAAADELMADPDFVVASKSATQKVMAAAERRGFHFPMPGNLYDPKD